MKERVTELSSLFARFQCIQHRLQQIKDTPEHDQDGTQDSTQMLKGLEERFRSVVACLLKASCKRAHPRIGVLSTRAEGVYEPRCSNKWLNSLKEMKNECMALEVQLQLKRTSSYEV
jgi:hypothetical protein